MSLACFLTQCTEGIDDQTYERDEVSRRHHRSTFVWRETRNDIEQKNSDDHEEGEIVEDTCEVIRVAIADHILHLS